MASSLFGQNPPAQPMLQGNPMQRLMQFAGMLQGRGDPQQLVMNYMQKNGITQDQLQQTMQQAQSIAQMLGIR